LAGRIIRAAVVKEKAIGITVAGTRKREGTAVVNTTRDTQAIGRSNGDLG